MSYRGLKDMINRSFIKKERTNLDYWFELIVPSVYLVLRGSDIFPACHFAL